MIWFAVAHAQTSGFDAHGFRFASASTDRRDPVQFQRPGDVEGLGWAVGALAEYATRPLIFRRDDGDDVALADLWVANVTGGFAPLDGLRLDVSAPLVLSSSDGEVRSGFAPGDLRASLLVAPISPADSGGFGLGLTASLDVPTGDPARYLGSTGIAGTVALTSTLEAGDGTFSAVIGGRFAPNTQPEERPAPTRGGDTIEGGAQMGWLLGQSAAVGVEAHVSVAIDPAVRTAIGIPASALGYVRYAVDRGNYVSAGLGVGLGVGAGASPLRFVIGGGFGGGGSSEAPSDRDVDGIIDRQDQCQHDAETLNQYRDADGCPDDLPILVFAVQRDGADVPDAALVVTDVNGIPIEGVGEVRVRGLPGATFRAHTEAPSCFGGSAQVEIPSEGTRSVVVPIVREEGQLDIVVTDTAGRPMPTAQVRYLLDDETCAPADPGLVDGRGKHKVGATSFLLFVTAPGYGVAQFPVDLKAGAVQPIIAKLAPTQVALKDGEVRFSVPLRFAAQSAEIAPGMTGLLAQVATVLSVNDDEPFEVWGFADELAVARRRAQVVVDWLVAAGVPAERLTAVGKGAAPAKQNDDVRILPRE